jgi:diguanylate cyclase (GGDEF)-like protein
MNGAGGKSTTRPSSQRFAVVAVDLDRFKEINDTWGHADGDTTIREVARRMAEACGRGRAGGAAGWR